MVTNISTQMAMVTSTSLTQCSPSSFGRTSDTPAASHRRATRRPPCHASEHCIRGPAATREAHPVVERAEVTMPRRTTLAVVAVAVAAAVVALVAVAGGGGRGRAAGGAR